MAIETAEKRGSIRFKVSKGTDGNGKPITKMNQFSGLKPLISDKLVYDFKKLIEAIQDDSILTVNRNRVFEINEA